MRFNRAGAGSLVPALSFNGDECNVRGHLTRDSKVAHIPSNFQLEAKVNKTLWALSGQYLHDELVEERVQAAAEHIPPPYDLIKDQIKRLKGETRVTVDKMARALEVETRSIYMHLAGHTIPLRRHLVAYEKLFSDLLNRSVTIQVQPKVTKR